MTVSPDDREVLHAAREIRRRVARERKAKRPKSPKADRGRVRNNAYLAWLRRQPCALASSWCAGPIDPAHIRTHKPGERPTGMQRKPDDFRATPLCRRHHIEQHDMREMAFWCFYGKDPFEVAAEHFARFEAEDAS